MTDQDRQALLDEANALGLEFHSNIPTQKLAALVAESQGPAVKEEPQEDEDVKQEDTPAPAAPATAKNLRHASRARRIAAAKKAAFATRIVTITNKDKRENEVMTTAYLSMENQHFGLSKIVPLDMQVELEQCLIDVAESTMITLHKDEIVNGQRTGNKVPIPTKKYIVSYSDKKPQ